MTRFGTALGIVALLAAACGSDSKNADTTTVMPPVTSEPMPEPMAEPAPEPVAAPEPPPAPEPTYLPGKWTWYELNTTDVDKAKTFYGELLGWTFEDKTMGEMTYTAILQDGKEIGLIQKLPADAKKKKAHWLGYVSVADPDAAVAGAQEAGATVVTPLTDAPDVGRFAVLKDKNGAMFGVIRGEGGDPADATPAPGQVVSMQYGSKNKKAMEADSQFYATLLGYNMEPSKMGKNDVLMAKVDGVNPRRAQAGEKQSGSRSVDARHHGRRCQAGRRDGEEAREQGDEGRQDHRQSDGGRGRGQLRGRHRSHGWR